MNTYAVVNNGIVTGVFLADSPVPVVEPAICVLVLPPERPMVGWYYAENGTPRKFTPGPRPVVNSRVALNSRISRGDFVQLFTPQEIGAVLSSQDPEVITFRWVLEQNDVIRKSNPLVTQGLQLLISKGLLTEQRAAEIMLKF